MFSQHNTGDEKEEGKNNNQEFLPQQIHLDHWAREFKYKRDTKAVMLKVVRIEKSEQ